MNDITHSRSSALPVWESGPVRVVFGEKQGKFPDGNQVVVTGKESKAIFDSPLSANQFPDELEGADLIINGHVHEDHVAAVHRFPNLPFYVPELDRYATASLEAMLTHYGYDARGTASIRQKLIDRFRFVPRPDAIGYRDGHTWELGGLTVRAIHMPGHTRGHSVLRIEPQGIAFIGDIDLSGFGPYYGDACSDLREFIHTLDAIEQMEATTWITFHHKGVITERETFLHLLRRFREQITLREQRLLAMIAKDGKTLEELAAQRLIYPPQYHSDTARSIERKTISEHLSLLMEQGQVTKSDGHYFRA